MTSGKTDNEGKDKEPKPTNRTAKQTDSMRQKSKGDKRLRCRQKLTIRAWEEDRVATGHAATSSRDALPQLAPVEESAAASRTKHLSGGRESARAHAEEEVRVATGHGCCQAPEEKPPVHDKDRG